MLDKLNKVLTPGRRKALYGLVAAIVACLVAFDIISGDDLASGVTNVVAVLGGLASIVAFVNVSPGPHDQ